MVLGFGEGRETTKTLLRTFGKVSIRKQPDRDGRNGHSMLWSFKRGPTGIHQSAIACSMIRMAVAVVCLFVCLFVCSLNQTDLVENPTNRRLRPKQWMTEVRGSESAIVSYA